MGEGAGGTDPTPAADQCEQPTTKADGSDDYQPQQAQAQVAESAELNTAQLKVDGAKKAVDDEADAGQKAALAEEVVKAEADLAAVKDRQKAKAATDVAAASLVQDDSAKAKLDDEGAGGAQKAAGCGGNGAHEQDAESLEHQAEFEKKVAAASALGLLQLPCGHRAYSHADCLLLYAAYSHAEPLLAKAAELKRLDEAASAAAQADEECLKKFVSDTEAVEAEYGRSWAEYEGSKAEARQEHAAQLDEWAAQVADARAKHSSDVAASVEEHEKDVADFEAALSDDLSELVARHKGEAEARSQEMRDLRALHATRELERCTAELATKSRLAAARRSMDVIASRAAKGELAALSDAAKEELAALAADMLRLEEQLCASLGECLRARRRQHAEFSKGRARQLGQVKAKMDFAKRCGDSRAVHALDGQLGRLRGQPLDTTFAKDVQVLEGQLRTYRNAVFRKEQVRKEEEDEQQGQQGQTDESSQPPPKPAPLVPAPLPARPEMSLQAKIGPEPIKPALPAHPEDTATAARKQLVDSAQALASVWAAAEMLVGGLDPLLPAHVHHLLAADDFDGAEKAQAAANSLEADLQSFSAAADEAADCGAARLTELLRQVRERAQLLRSPGAERLLRRCRPPVLAGTPSVPISLQPTALTPLPRDNCVPRSCERTKAAWAAHKDVYGTT
jgi:hypothetical protein